MLFQVENDGPDIVSTNYFDSVHAARGFFYLSINAGTFRLLVPDVKISEITEFSSAKEVIVSRGPWPDMGKQDALEILFEDYSQSPYALHMLIDQVGRLPLDTDRDRAGQPPRWRFSVWTRGGKVLDLPCRYRIVRRLPWLKAWDNKIP